MNDEQKEPKTEITVTNRSAQSVHNFTVGKFHFEVLSTISNISQWSLNIIFKSLRSPIFQYSLKCLEICEKNRQ